MARESCSTGNGQGGWWETGNSTRNTPPNRWITCSTCNGTGVR